MMVLTKNSICEFGWKARDFALKGMDGKPIRWPMCADQRACLLSSSAIIVRM